ncbi:MAG: DUF4347 domain-containing protein [Acidobacteria bacterium]|mgnify:CR=1 FL=1|nr:MAG: DUF4347 domain-containing protein [Acidobacteriota bacterium]REJ98384.1 MAG: DUF4347 domain-containing protein [Acidobacteriota bacterium]REK17128.1 MAG: DUF4347 domain-containing protein [Acidobacteriota bacterium]REK43038.1 MAG: DUF4347 domain-containing protein [Acidobacteriota bacterium]
MMVYVVDRRVPRPPRPSGLGGLVRHNDNFEQGWRRVIEEFPGHEDAQMLFVESGEPFQALSRRISQTVSNPWSIWMLRIICHGAPAFLQLGAGVGRREVRHFRNIRHSMTPSHLRGRGIEIHGCNVAEGTQGRRFVQQIATAINLPVVASPHIQQADNMFRFEGGDLLRIDP